jgi:hypothetical protein
VALPNRAMKLTRLSPAAFRGRSAGSCPRRTISDAGTASQLIAVFDGRGSVARNGLTDGRCEVRRVDGVCLLLGVLLSGIGCADECANLSCAPDDSAVITVTAEGSGAPVAGATVHVLGSPANPRPCGTRANTTECVVSGHVGTYTFEIAAPGYQSTQRTVTVRAIQGECDCYAYDTQHLAVSLMQATP